MGLMLRLDTYTDEKGLVVLSFFLSQSGGGGGKEEFSSLACDAYRRHGMLSLPNEVLVVQFIRTIQKRVKHRIPVSPFIPPLQSLPFSFFLLLLLLFILPLSPLRSRPTHLNQKCALTGLQRKVRKKKKKGNICLLHYTSPLAASLFMPVHNKP
ncbi:hypothetical protein TRVL_07806 [Trypanosoma vivax]|nr:hypothetical protein TRVL_07806 [Trypanosoma vivax]